MVAARERALHHFQHATWMLLASARSARCVTVSSRAATSAGV
jgi:hypothetical protein